MLDVEFEMTNDLYANKFQVFQNMKEEKQILFHFVFVFFFTLSLSRARA